MERKIKSLIRHLKLLYLFTRLSYQTQMEYRLNFAMGFVVETSYFLIKLSYLIVVIRTGVKVNGLTPDMVMIFIGIYCFMTGVWMMLSGVNSFPYKIRSGDLDILITKPVSLQFIQSFSFVDIAMTIPNMGFGTLLICLGWARAGISTELTHVFGFILIMLMSSLLTYAMSMIPAMLAFWLISTNGAYMLYAALWDFNNMPMNIYQRIIQRIGVFVIPIFIVTNWPGMFAINKLSPFFIFWGIFVTVALLVLTRIMFIRGMRKYTSAGG